MKKRFIKKLLLSVMICCCLTACEKQKNDVDTVVVTMDEGKLSFEQNASIETEKSETSSTDEFVTETKNDFDYQAQVQIMFEHSQWLSYNEKVSYAFCDLDGNGRMEVIVCEKNENGEPYSPKFFEVTKDFDDVEECSFETNCYIYDIDNSTCIRSYVDPDTGKISYLMKSDEEYEGRDLFYYYELVLDNGSVSEYAVCSETPLGYYNSNFERIDDEQFDIDIEVNRYFEGKNPDRAPVFLFDPLEGDGLHGKIEDSINTFNL